MSKAQEPASRYKGSYSAFFLPLGVLVIGAFLSYGLGALDNARHRDNDRADLALQLSSLGTRLAERVRFAFSGTEGIAQLVSIDGSISPQHFRRMAHSAIDAVPYIRHIVIAPDDVILDTYPLAGNESIIGLDYRSRPNQYPLVEKARATGAALLAGPVELYQGGMELIYRRPVFLSAHQQHEVYWGVISVVTSTEALLKAAGLEEEEGLRVALRGHDGLGAAGQVIYGNSALFDSDPVMVDVSIPGGSWQLVALPKSGWVTRSILDSSLFLLAISTSILLSLFILQASLNHSLIRRRNAELREEITEREVVTSSLVQSEDRFRMLFERSPDPIWIRGQDGRINLGNTAAMKALGFKGDSFPSVTVADISPRFQPDGQSSVVKAAALRVEVEREGSLRFEWDHKRVDGSVFPTEVTLCTMQLAQELVTYAIVRDVTVRKEAERGLERMAHFDSVTGLPNRVLFHEQLIQGIEQAKRQNNCMAVLMLDLDSFKLVNDSLGHPMGDLLLQQATHRFVDAARFGDVVARLGGDEFGFILDGLECEADVVPVVGRILQSLHKPFNLDGTAALVTASIGVTMYPENGTTAQALLTQADTAMYAAKEAGRNDFCFYQPHMTTLIQARVALEAAIRQALERNEFEVWYQPKRDLKTGKVEGAEALIRWRSPTLGLVSPADFIPLAERTGLIVSIGQWVLDQVCRQARLWRDSGQYDQHVAINVAVMQIERSDFVEDVRLALARYDLPARALEVEVTESLIMNRQELAHTVLSQLRSMGLSVAIDDFGTGYSSLAYLKDLPIDNLKIDRTFISGLPHDKAYVAITQAVIELGHALGYTVTAEGIETAEQLAFLSDAGCDTGQGYLISRPMPLEEFEAWLAEAVLT